MGFQNYLFIESPWHPLFRFSIIVFENRLKALKTRLLLLAANRRGARIQTASDYFNFIII